MSEAEPGKDQPQRDLDARDWGLGSEAEERKIDEWLEEGRPLRRIPRPKTKAR